MKKIICGMLFLLAAGMGFTSCSDDDDDITISHSTTPEIASAGTYSGTWTKEQVGGETSTAPGTLVLAATDAEGKSEKYITYVTVSSAELKLEKSSNANISYANDFYWFSNMNTTNGFGTKFSGKINADGSATISFSLTEKQGRKTYVFNYSFTGKKS